MSGEQRATSGRRTILPPKDEPSNVIVLEATNGPVPLSDPPRDVVDAALPGASSSASSSASTSDAPAKREDPT